MCVLFGWLVRLLPVKLADYNRRTKPRRKKRTNSGSRFQLNNRCCFSVSGFELNQLSFWMFGLGSIQKTFLFSLLPSFNWVLKLTRPPYSEVINSNLHHYKLKILLWELGKNFVQFTTCVVIIGHKKNKLYNSGCPSELMKSHLINWYNDWGVGYYKKFLNCMLTIIITSKELTTLVKINYTAKNRF